MCGIWAFLQPKQPKDNLVDQFHDFFQLKHRGPDHTHFETYGPITFGFHRLAIVDTSFAGNQPFKKEDSQRTVFLMCNGEIYNYKELIEEFKLDSSIKNDCCILLEIYWKLLLDGCEADFPKIIQHRIKGEYAFLLVEMDALKNVRQVIACRDTVGVRPLYASTMTAIQSGHGLLFTSEVKGARSYSGEIKEFPPGHLTYYCVDMFGDVSIHDHSLTSHLYLRSFDDFKQDSELLYDLRQTVADCVQRRLSADRPIAFLTSGGIDSSLVTALSAKLLGKPIRTFCCGITEGGVAVGRDLEYAREVSQWIGSDHTEVLFTKEEALAAIPDVVRTVESWDTTTIRASVGQYLVCKWIGENTDCRVVLVGEGPDEVCSSYLFNWYAPDGKALDDSARDYVKNIHLYDARRADRCIARWGLEARVPFLDPEFIQTYWRIPANERMPKTRGIEKWWLREAFKGTDILPERVRLRMKDAFSDSISGQVSWTQIIQEWVADKVSDDEMARAAETYPWCTPQTKEAYYYRKLFCQIHGQHRQKILPGYWQPRWNANGVEVSGYVDPSARTLGVYSSLTQS